MLCNCPNCTGGERHPTQCEWDTRIAQEIGTLYEEKQDLARAEKLEKALEKANEQFGEALKKLGEEK